MRWWNILDIRTHQRYWYSRIWRSCEAQKRGDSLKHLMVSRKSQERTDWLRKVWTPNVQKSKNRTWKSNRYADSWEFWSLVDWMPIAYVLCKRMKTIPQFALRSCTILSIGLWEREKKREREREEEEIDVREIERRGRRITEYWRRTSRES